MLLRAPLIAMVATALACGGSGGDGPDGGPPDGDGGGSGDGAVTPAGQAVFAPDVLHAIELTVDAQYLATLDDDGSTVRVPATISFDGTVVAQVGLRKKGASSRRPLSGKSGFTVKFNEFVPGQKLDGLKKLTIDNAIEDPSLLTGHLSYEVYRRAGLPAPRTAHATLTFNGVDKGLFVIEEPTNDDYLAAHFGVRAILVPAADAAGLGPAGTRVAEGGAEAVDIIRLNRPADALVALKERGLPLFVADAHEGESVFTVELPPRCVLALGAEREGISDALRKLARRAVFIPGTGSVESLNVATAAGVLLAEHVRRHGVVQAVKAARP